MLEWLQHVRYWNFSDKYTDYLDNKFNVQGSVHHKNIPFDIFPTRCNITQFIYFWKTALLVSGGISTHHQEHTTVCTVTGTCQTVTVTCRYCGRVGTGLRVVWELLTKGIVNKL